MFKSTDVIASKDRFALEEDINKCWGILDDIDELLSRVDDGIPGQKDLDRNDIANYLLGLKNIYEAKFQRLDDTMKQVFTLKPYTVHTKEKED